MGLIILSFEIYGSDVKVARETVSTVAKAASNSAPHARLAAMKCATNIRLKSTPVDFPSSSHENNRLIKSIAFLADGSIAALSNELRPSKLDDDGYAYEYHTVSCYTPGSKEWTQLDDNWMMAGADTTHGFIKQVEGGLIATAEDWHASVRLIDCKARWFSNIQKIMEISGEKSTVTDLLEFSPLYTIVGYSDGSIRLFNKKISTPICTRKYKPIKAAQADQKINEEHTHSDIRLRRSGDKILSVSTKAIASWHLKDDVLVQGDISFMPPQGAHFIDCGITSDGGCVVAVKKAGSTFLWNLNKELHFIDAAEEQVQVLSSAFSSFYEHANADTVVEFSNGDIGIVGERFKRYASGEWVKLFKERLQEWKVAKPSYHDAPWYEQGRRESRKAQVKLSNSGHYEFAIFYNRSSIKHPFFAHVYSKDANTQNDCAQ